MNVQAATKSITAPSSASARTGKITSTFVARPPPCLSMQRMFMSQRRIRSDYLQAVCPTKSSMKSCQAGGYRYPHRTRSGFSMIAG
ncbi:hypothetical protein AB205_0190600 [Aquarana catesbeiana]|uniref:Uncharacterized protein n=1 Tax=Aquarana catesbeiana TaxID=8400 RepID=A0A2G9P400_AQUCT|nr:hypothetical protein AB205_0190600 [Aquarana catesbeiana]